MKFLHLLAVAASVFLLSKECAHASKEEIDKKAIINTASQNEEIKAADEYMNMADEYAKLKSHAEAVEYYDRAASLYEKLGQSREAADAYMKLSEELEKSGDDLNSVFCRKHAADLYKIANEEDKAANAYMDVAEKYAESNSHSEAAECYQRAADIYDKLCWKSEAADAYRKAAEKHAELKSHAKAVEYYDRAASLYEKLGQSREAADAYMKLSEELEKSGDDFNSVFCRKNAADLYKIANEEDKAANAYMDVAEKYAESNSHSEAAECYQRAADIYDFNNEQSRAVNAYIKAAEEYAKSNLYTNAVKCYEKLRHHYRKIRDSKEEERIIQVIKTILSQEQYDAARKAFFNRRKSLNWILMEISREEVLESLRKELMAWPAETWKEHKVKIKFTGEAGVDEGGLTREFFTLFFREIVNHKLLVLSGDRHTYQLNQAKESELDLAMYEAIGRAFALALLMGVQLPFDLHISLLKGMLRQPVEFEDMKNYDHEYYNQLKSILKMNGEDLSDTLLNFAIRMKEKEYLLSENGLNRQVNRKNVKEFVDRLVKIEQYDCFKLQIDPFLQGFHGVLYEPALQGVDVDGLGLLLSSHSEIDVEDWQKNTKYEDYTEGSIPVQMFWRAVKKMTPEKRAQLLMFVTGSDRLPLEGFKSLDSSFTIVRVQLHDKFNVPKARTCFNQILLPAYETEKQLEEGLSLALKHGMGFGLA